jgi:hypothetical protein
MENGVVFAGLSLAVTLLTSLFKTASLSVKQKNLIATGLSIVAGAVAVYINNDGDFSGSTIAATATAVYGGAQLAYNFILKGTGLNAKLSNTNLFGVSSADMSNLIAKAEVVEKAVKRSAPVAKPPVKKAPAKKTTTTKAKAK